MALRSRGSRCAALLLGLGLTGTLLIGTTEPTAHADPADADRRSAAAGVTDPPLPLAGGDRGERM